MSDPAVVGIDTNSFGFHAVSSIPVRMPGDENGDERTYGWTISTSKEAQDRRYVTFTMARPFFASLPRASAVFIEEPIIMMKNPETTRKLAMIAGVIEAAFFDAAPDATLFWVNLSTWRKRVLGIGSGPTKKMKELARDWVHNQWLVYEPSVWLPIEADFDNQADLYDAQCICAYGMWALSAEQVKIR